MNMILSFRRIISWFVTIATMVYLSIGGIGDVFEMNKVYLDYPYGTAERQIMDICIPKEAEGETGLILFIHGGAWMMGNKKEYRSLLDEWSRKGYVTAAMNYRFVNEEIDAFDIMEDITDALAAAKKVADKNGVTLKKCLLTGASAGAHLCMLYAYSRREEAPVQPACVVEYCGPSDFTKTDFMLNPDLLKPNSYCCGFTYNAENFEEGLPHYKAVSPITYIESAVPTVIAHGVSDEIVPFSQAELLDEALTKQGIAHDFIVYQSGHGVTADKVSFAKTDVLFAQYAAAYLK